MSVLGSVLGTVQQIIIFVFVIAALFGFYWSVVRILHRMGLSGWWVLLAGLWPIMLPILAICRWPAFEANRDSNLRT